MGVGYFVPGLPETSNLDQYWKVAEKHYRGREINKPCCLLGAF